MRTHWLRALAFLRVDLPGRDFFPSRSKLVKSNCEYLTLYFADSPRSSDDLLLHLKPTTKLPLDLAETSKGSSILPSRGLPGKQAENSSISQKKSGLFFVLFQEPHKEQIGGDQMARGQRLRGIEGQFGARLLVKMRSAEETR